jgi:predicted nucleic acid-binding protein
VEFLDTNILVYAASEQRPDHLKATHARTLLRSGIDNFAISLQVLQEFYQAARHPRKLALTHQEAIILCQEWRQFTVLEPTLGLFDESLRLCDRFQINYYDAAIIAAARQLGCAIVYSEDLNHGQDYDGVQVVNPFLGL